MVNGLMDITMDWSPGSKPWSNAMEILHEKDGVDTELLVYAMTLINKVSMAIVSYTIL